ncbi:T9SS type A sorting domain-containing protein [Flavobacterium sp. N1994]|uniref:T9SS type A sorting domain-containing protein n=1 Tax=Flavobacterium sp. N1994 TaxID=2986827 RepID=UPI002223957D|nr:T9SS type A sorting domain-containing protein [Flavobacterium sp. N1994]
MQVDYVRAYLPANENATRHNKDISATYTIGLNNCYNLGVSSPVIWNTNYKDEIIYPNPLATETKIEFSLATAEQISITIYNELGQLVKNLVTDNQINEGKFEVIWDGKNNSGDEVANGIYIYKITGEKGTLSTGKIIVKR